MNVGNTCCKYMWLSSKVWLIKLTKEGFGEPATQDVLCGNSHMYFYIGVNFCVESTKTFIHCSVHDNFLSFSLYSLNYVCKY